MSFPMNMKTGFGDGVENDINDVELKRIASILSYFMRKSIEVGTVYVKEAGRETLTSTDVLYALQYQAQNFTDTINNDISLETTLVDLENEMDSDSEEEESDEEESDEEESDEEEEDFTRAESDNPVISEMNRCHDTWEDWEPQDHIQSMIKRAVDRVKMSM